jgi:endonuclease YncB( thermonuclease family)
MFARVHAFLKNRKQTLESTSTMTPMFTFVGTRRAKVVRVYDGDTLFACFELDGCFYQFRVRLTGIDAPEMKLAPNHPSRDQVKVLANAAKQELQSKVLDKIVKLECHGFDKYGRVLATVFVDNLNINNYLLEKGLVVPYDGGTKIH